MSTLSLAKASLALGKFQWHRNGVTNQPNTYSANRRQSLSKGLIRIRSWTLHLIYPLVQWVIEKSMWKPGCTGNRHTLKFLLKCWGPTVGCIFLRREEGLMHIQHMILVPHWFCWILNYDVDLRLQLYFFTSDKMFYDFIISVESINLNLRNFLGRSIIYIL